MIKKLQLNMTNGKRHITAWIGYAIYFYAINRMTNDQLEWKQVGLTIPFFMIIFYVVVSILQRFWGKGKKFLSIILLLGFYALLGLFIYLFLYSGTGSVLNQGRYIVQDDQFSTTEFFQSFLVVLGNYTGFALVYYHVSKTVTEMKKRYQAEALKNKFEYVSLAGQVSPHLMANLFAKWERSFNRGEVTVVNEVRKAYEMMVFYMNANALESKSVTLLEDEVNQLESYRDMLMASSDHPKYIRISQKGSCLGKVIPPTTLISVLENADKHGVVNDPAHPVILSLTCSDHSIHIECTNKIASRSKVPSHGTGIRNLKRRLELHYETAVSFHVQEEQGHYTVSIKIHF